MQSVAEVLGRQGPVAELIEGFTPRQQQQEMAGWVADVLEEGGTLVCEAGTGTGKTFAYLVPVLLSGCRTIISTGSKTLQDQLYHRDLPTIRRALKVPVSIALLKGRSNYLCLHRLETASLEISSRGRALQADLVKVRNWAAQTESGDRAELSDVKEDASIWPMVTSTVENCLGQECAFFDDCHVVKARKAAIKADVLVVNHHLFMADMALREQGFGELLPGADAVIFDEAHQLHDIASDFFGDTLSSRQVLDLVRDVTAAQLAEADDMPGLTDVADALDKAARDLRLSFGVNNARGDWASAVKQEEIQAALERLRQCIDDLGEVLEQVAERGRMLEACHRRARKLRQLLSLFLPVEETQPGQQSQSVPPQTGLHDNEQESEQTDKQPADEPMVAWYEAHQRGFLLHATPLNIASVFAQRRKAYGCSWVYTSATLAIGDRFDHFLSRLGLEGAQTARWESPFDYQQQSLLYLPALQCEPRSRDYTQAVIDAALPVIEASGGRCFFLFTSHRALREAADRLADTLEFPLLVQGDAPRNELLDRFRYLGNAVLLGAASFWEGVDVRGEALSCVIIDKLPFATPDDPVMQARLDALRRQGGNPFMDYQVPEAAIALKQGAGRLIRDSADRGVLMLCDPRITGKPYGKVFLRAIPPMPVCRDINQLQAFLSAEACC